MVEGPITTDGDNCRLSIILRNTLLPLPLKAASPNERYINQRVGRQDYNDEQQLAKYNADPAVYPRVSTAPRGVELHRKCTDGCERATEAINESLKSGTRVRSYVRVFVLQDMEHA